MTDYWVSTPIPLELSEEEKKKRIDDFLPNIESILKIINDPNWKLLKKKPGYQVYWMNAEGTPIVSIKGEAVIDASQKELFDFFSDFYKCTGVDPMLREGKIISDLGNHHLIGYLSFYVAPMVSNRDFVIHGYDVILEDGTGLSIGRSVEVDKFPARSGQVRASINMSGYVYKPLENDPSKCLVQYVVNVDPKGWLPYWLVNLTAGDQGANVKVLQDYFVSVKTGTEIKKKKEKKDKYKDPEQK